MNRQTKRRKDSADSEHAFITSGERGQNNSADAGCANNSGKMSTERGNGRAESSSSAEANQIARPEAISCLSDKNDRFGKGYSTGDQSGPPLAGVLDDPNTRFKTYFEPLLEGLWYIAFWYVKNAAAAEDVRQNASIKLWQTCRRTIIIKDPEAYAYVIVRNEALNWLDSSNRRRRKEKECTKKNADSATTPVPPDIEIELAETCLLVRAALDDLLPVHREVLRLTYVYDFSWAAISRHLGWPEATVRSRHATALRLLAQKLRQRDAL